MTTPPLREQILDRRGHSRVENRGVLPRIEHHDASLFRARDLEISLANPLVEGAPHALERVEPPAADARHAYGGIEVEQQREIRQHPAGGEGIEIADGLQVHPLPKALIR